MQKEDILIPHRSPTHSPIHVCHFTAAVMSYENVNTDRLDIRCHGLELKCSRMGLQLPLQRGWSSIKATIIQ